MTVQTLLKTLREALSPYDAQIIAESLLKCSHTELILRSGEKLSDEIVREAMRMKERREQGEPIQYITGEWRFFGRDYVVGEGVLIPRDDTEVLVAESLRLIPENTPMKVLDLCAGSGIIAITIKKERPLCEVFAVEKSDRAFSYLTQNTQKHHADVNCILSDLNDCVVEFPDGSLDLIVSNPPYIKTADLPALQREVQFEPKLALDGGSSGYDFYESIIALYTDKLRQGGYFAFEIGEDQSGYIAELLTNAGFGDIHLYKDIGNIPRAITAKKIF